MHEKNRYAVFLCPTCSRRAARHHREVGKVTCGIQHQAGCQPDLGCLARSLVARLGCFRSLALHLMDGARHDGRLIVVCLSRLMFILTETVARARCFE